MALCMLMNRSIQRVMCNRQTVLLQESKLDLKVAVLISRVNRSFRYGYVQRISNQSPIGCLSARPCRERDSMDNQKRKTDRISNR